MRKSSTIANSAPCITGVVGILSVLLFTTAGRGAECSKGTGLTSNYILSLAGNGDTLAMFTAKDQVFALNGIAGRSALAKPEDENNWWSYTFGCKNQGVYELAYGGGYAFASIDTAPNVLWTYHLATKKVEEVPIAWPTDTTRQFVVLDAVWSKNSFYLAAQDGGLVRWSPSSNERQCFFPGVNGSYKQTGFTSRQKPLAFPYNDTTLRVTGVASIKSDSLIAVTTPSRILLFSVADSSWDSSVTTTLQETDLPFVRFKQLFMNTLDTSRPLYSTIAVKVKKTGDDTTYLYKYNRNSARWELLLAEAPKAISFGRRGYIYALFDERRSEESLLQNIIRMYRDTSVNGVQNKNPAPVASTTFFDDRMTQNYPVDIPDVINDILYQPFTDSTGYLWIATSDGLFFSPRESGIDTAALTLIKRAPPVKDGLKTTYARPGIIDPYVSNCKFIYNIAASEAKVTIAVYDYNMDLVKLVIKNRVRHSGSNGGPLGRSTVESEDQWDGKNEQHRPCAPGVYYYKITTDSGERSFGKIVIAH